MKRPEFIKFLGSAAALPSAAHAQQRAMPVISFLSVSSPGPHAPFVAAFNQGLKEVGLVEGCLPPGRRRTRRLAYRAGL
jgi:putative tryptophan/tyrosine transport system substrate-binding protein